MKNEVDKSKWEITYLNREMYKMGCKNHINDRNIYIYIYIEHDPHKHDNMRQTGHTNGHVLTRVETDFFFLI